MLRNIYDTAYPGKEWIPCRDMLILWSTIRRLREVPVWRLGGYGDLPSSPLWLGLLRMPTAVLVNEVAGICQSQFFWQALVPQVAIWEVSVSKSMLVW